MGAGRIYINVEGRGPDGGVREGPAYDRLVADLRAGLIAISDPSSGRLVIDGVRTGREAYAGAHLGEAPDLVVTFAPGYGGSLDSRLGGAATVVVAPNQERWQADHEGMDENRVPGVWLSSVPLGAEAISVLDVAPTVLQYFGQAPPAQIEGRPQLRNRLSSASRR
jgi:predicted AlkP superfamily phosphohydrolase/phosphomutase